jgi:hypothetical protein
VFRIFLARIKHDIANSLFVCAVSIGVANAAPLQYTIERIGLAGAGYTQDFGEQRSVAQFLNDHGQVAGYSNRYSGSSGLGQDAWLYEGSSTLQVGLIGAGYERGNGYRYSHAQFLSNQGNVVGYSNRYSGSSELGFDTWFYNGSSTIQVGLTGFGYEQTNGYRASWVYSLNEQGQAAGRSVRYSGSSDLGYDAWLYNGSSTIQLGFTGAGYEHSGFSREGYRDSNVLFLNEQGHVAGHSQRYSVSTGIGQDAWLYNGISTIQLGFTGAGYEASNGGRYSTVQFLNEQGQVAGHSGRFSGSGDLGQDAWLYNGSSTIQLGLTGAGYERNDGYRLSSVALLNERGQVTGHSTRYTGSSRLGYDAWLFNGSSTIQLGLTGVGYERNDGYRVSNVTLLNEQGQVAGNSYRYSGGTDIGQDTGMGFDAWLYNGSSTIQLGFTGAGYERNDGYRGSDVQSLNEQGQVAGYSHRFAGSTLFGQDAWLYNGSSTIQLGFTGAGYEQSNGYRYSYAQFLNEQGQVTGYSERYAGSTQLGQDAWLYDANLNQVFNLTLSVRPSDNYAFSEVQYLGADGLVLGYYELFDQSNGWSLGNRAFYFTVDDGIYDLDLLVDDLVADDWIVLANAISAGDMRNFIIGHGTLTGMTGQAAYLLTAALRGLQKLDH